jgi:hypothetical protein
MTMQAALVRLEEVYVRGVEPDNYVYERVRRPLLEMLSSFQAQHYFMGDDADSERRQRILDLTLVDLGKARESLEQEFRTKRDLFRLVFLLLLWTASVQPLGFLALLVALFWTWLALCSQHNKDLAFVAGAEASVVALRETL